MGKYCLDTSVVIKILTHEDGSDIAINLLENILKNQSIIIQPHFFEYEIYATLLKKYHFKYITRTELNKSLEFFKKLPIEYYDYKLLIPEALTLSLKLKLPTIYDSTFAVVAINNKAKFVTADTRFYTVIKRVYAGCSLLAH